MNEEVLMRFESSGEETIEIARSTIAGVPRAHLRTYASIGPTSGTSRSGELSFPLGRLDTLCEAVQMLRDRLGNSTTGGQ